MIDSYNTFIRALIAACLSCAVTGVCRILPVTFGRTFPSCCLLSQPDVTAPATSVRHYICFTSAADLLIFHATPIANSHSSLASWPKLPSGGERYPEAALDQRQPTKTRTPRQPLWPLRPRSVSSPNFLPTSQATVMLLWHLCPPRPMIVPFWVRPYQNYLHGRLQTPFPIRTPIVWWKES